MKNSREGKVSRKTSSSSNKSNSDPSESWHEDGVLLQSYRKIEEEEEPDKNAKKRMTAPSVDDIVLEFGQEESMEDDDVTVEENTSRCGVISFLYNIFGLWVLWCRFLLLIFERSFISLSRTICKHPGKTILVSLLVVILCSLGLLRMQSETRTEKLYIPQDSQAMKDLRNADQFFHIGLRQEEIILLPKDGNNILTKDCLNEALRIHEKIISTPGFADLCHKSNVPGQRNDCLVVSPLQILDYSSVKLQSTVNSMFSEAFTDMSYMMANGRPFIYNEKLTLGQYRNRDVSAGSMRMLYMMTNADEDVEDIYRWEKLFTSQMEQIKNELVFTEIYYATGRSLDDAIQESTGTDLMYFSATMTIMIMFTCLMLGKFTNPVTGHSVLANTGVFAVALGILMGFGLSFAFGVPFVAMVGVLPFLVIGVGIDDMFIMIDELDRQNPAQKTKTRVKNCMSKIGATITMTTMTDLAAFAVSTTSSFPAIKYFCAYAALSITSAFFLLITLFVAFMVFDSRRIKRGLMECLPCLKAPTCGKGHTWITSTQSISSKIMEAYAKLLTKLPVKIVVVILSLVTLGLGIRASLEVDQTFQRQLLCSDGSQYKTFLDKLDRNFIQYIEVNIVADGYIDYSDPAVQAKYRNLGKIAMQNENFRNDLRFNWLDSFTAWAYFNGKPSSGKEFYRSLREFLNDPQNYMFRQDVVFEETHSGELQIASTRILVYTKSSLESTFQAESMLSIRASLKMHSDLPVYPIAQSFIYFEQYAIIMDETIHNLKLTSLVILVMTAPFLIHPIIILLVALGFVALIFELLGLMFLWSVPLNAISMINLVMSICFAVDYSAHVAMAFISSHETTPDNRVVEALQTVGASVFMGGLSTFLGLCVTAFASSQVFLVFFKMFVGIVVFGLVHGLVYLPVYLSLFGHLLISIENMEVKLPWLIKSFLNKKREREEDMMLLLNNRDSKRTPKLAVSIVGISCRFPKANSKTQFWSMLTNKECGICDYPDNRKETTTNFTVNFHPERSALGKLYVKTGGFIDDVLSFDAPFFGVTQAEANAMDPQHRLLLHVVYEAIEDAGLKLEDLQQCKTGVFVGLMNADYAFVEAGTGNLSQINQHYTTGNTVSMASNRISFALNLTGPSMTIDTACSSTLIALKVATDQLSSKECDVAIVCGCNLLLNYVTQITTCRAGFLAPDGRCKTFDISSDGYGRGEGIAAIIIKPTPMAICDNDNPYCEVISCGMNNDGHNAVPITAPSAQMQIQVSRRVLESSGYQAEDIDYIECHGTGTAIGDVIELNSISEVYCNTDNGRDEPLRAGSVKTNINHTEAVAGLAGLIKLSLMLKHEKYLPTIGVKQQNPKLSLHEKGIQVQTEVEDWLKKPGKPRLASINSFGYGGSNAHAIVRESHSPDHVEDACIQRDCYVATLSARSVQALKEMASTHAQWLKVFGRMEDDMVLGNICYSLNERRSQHDHRLATVFSDLDELIQTLNDYGESEGDWEKSLLVDKASDALPQVVYLFGGQGSQWFGMAQQMMKYEPLFMESIERVDRVMAKRYKMEWSLVEELQKSEEDSCLKEPTVSQPAVFAIQFAIAELLKSWGIHPAAVAGHSLGEFAAACISGALSLVQALGLVLLRSRLHQSCRETGGMAALGMSEEDTNALLHELELQDVLQIAALNDAKNVTVTGDKEAIEALGKHLEVHHADIFWRILNTTRAFHSYHMDEIESTFRTEVRKLRLSPKVSTVPFISTVTGQHEDGSSLDSSYWWNNIRNQVKFYPAMKQLFEDGHTLFVEISPQPTLPHYINAIAVELNLIRNLKVLTTLPRRKIKEQHRMFLQNTVAKLYTMGYPINWQNIQGAGTMTFYRSPSYPWQLKNYWHTESVPPSEIGPLHESEGKEEHTAHPFLYKSVGTTRFSKMHCWEAEIDLYHFPFLRDHKLARIGVVIPGTAYIEMAMAMAKDKFISDVIEVTDIRFMNLMTLPEGQIRKMRMRLDCSKSTTGGEFLITCVQQDQAEIVIAKGEIVIDGGKQHTDLSKTVDVAACSGPYLPRPDGTKIEQLLMSMNEFPMEKFQTRVEKLGFQYGPYFSLIQQAWQGDHEALAHIKIKGVGMYLLHPGLMDCCLQTSILTSDQESDKAVVPIGVDSICLLASQLPPEVFCHTVVTRKVVNNEEQDIFDMTITDTQGKPVALVRGFRVGSRESGAKNLVLDDISYESHWVCTPLPEVPEELTVSDWLIVRSGQDPSVDQLKSRLIQDGAQVTILNVPLDDEIENYAPCLEKALEDCVDGKKSFGVINALPLAMFSLELDADNWKAAQGISFIYFSTLLNTLQQKYADNKPRLVILTRHAKVICVTDKTQTSGSSVWASTVWGLRRVAVIETPKVKTLIVDMSHDQTGNEIKSLMQELHAGTDEDEVAFRGKRRYVNRLEYSRNLTDQENVLSKSIPQDQVVTTPFHVVVDAHNECVEFSKGTRGSLSKNTVKIFISYSSVCEHFTTCDDANTAHVIGFCGKVMEVGEDVTRVLVGDMVSGMCHCQFLGNFVIVDEALVFPLMTNLSLPQNASLPLAMSVAYEVLRNSARVLPGQRVLIHEADDELSLAGIILATSLKCRVSVTGKNISCAHKAKLIELGVTDVIESMTMSLNQWYGEGFDVVLCFKQSRQKTLEWILDGIKSGGRLIIVGENYSHFAFSSNKRLGFERIIVSEFFEKKEYLDHLVNGWRTHLQTNEAFQKAILGAKQTIHDVFTLQRNQSLLPASDETIQFNTLSFENENMAGKHVQIKHACMYPEGFKSDRSYMVVGGVRGYGFEVAKWMIDRGARSLVLTARSKPTTEKEEEIRALEEKTGAKVHVMQVDVTSREQMMSLGTRLQSFPPMAGIVNSAMVLDDKPLTELDEESVWKVMAPKIAGALLLHELSLDMDLDLFVMFSSVTSVLGNKNQASYAGANSFLDELAHYRRHVLNLPALTINWGPISGAGVLDRDKSTATLLAKSGFGLIPADRGVELIGEILLTSPGTAQICLLDLDWSKIFKISYFKVTPRTAHLVPKSSDSGMNDSSIELLAQQILMETDPEKRKELIWKYVLALVEWWMGASPGDMELDHETALINYGVDSAGALALKLRIEGTLQISFETFYFTQPETSITRLVEDIATKLDEREVKLGGPPGGVEAFPGGPPPGMGPGGGPPPGFDFSQGPPAGFDFSSGPPEGFDFTSGPPSGLMFGGMMGPPKKKKKRRPRKKVVEEEKEELVDKKETRRMKWGRWSHRKPLMQEEVQEMVAVEENAHESDRLVEEQDNSEGNVNDDEKKAEKETEEVVDKEKEDESEEEDDEDSPDLIPLYTPPGASVKLFCVHPSHRYGLTLMPFATGLSFQTMVSMYGIGFTDPTKIGRTWASVSELAEEYIDLIKDEQSHGPYFLCGYSFGGIMAYEMACQLTQEGHEVSYVGMIDTVPWYPQNRVNAMKLKSVIWEDFVNSHLRTQVVLQYEVFLQKMSTRMMKLTPEEYTSLREKIGSKGIEEEIKKISTEQNIPFIDMALLNESLLHDQENSQKTHDEWQPPKVRYPGRVTYLRAQDGSLTPQIPAIGTAVECWTEVANGNLDEFIVPGNHYTLSEMPLARNVGGVLASTVAMAFRKLFPNLGIIPRTRMHELAVRKVATNGVKILVYSKRDYKQPSARLLRLSKDGKYLLFFSVISTQKQPRLRKRIQLKDILAVIPSRYCPRAFEDLHKNRKGAHRDIHISEMVSLVTSYRTYNLACMSDSCTPLEIITALQAILKVPILS